MYSQFPVEPNAIPLPISLCLPLDFESARDIGCALVHSRDAELAHLAPRTAPWCTRVTSMLLVLPTYRVRFKRADHQAQTSTATFHRRVPGNFTVVAKRFLCAEHAENEIWKEDMACKIDVYLLPWPLDDKVADFTFPALSAELAVLTRAVSEL